MVLLSQHYFAKRARKHEQGSPTPVTAAKPQPISIPTAAADSKHKSGEPQVAHSVDVSVSAALMAGEGECVPVAADSCKDVNEDDGDIDDNAGEDDDGEDEDLMDGEDEDAEGEGAMDVTEDGDVELAQDDDAPVENEDEGEDDESEGRRVQSEEEQFVIDEMLGRSAAAGTGGVLGAEEAAALLLDSSSVPVDASGALDGVEELPQPAQLKASLHRHQVSDCMG